VVLRAKPYAAELFLEDLDVSIARIQEAPEVWPRYRQKWRRFVFRRFLFNLIYRVQRDHIQVVASRTRGAVHRIGAAADRAATENGRSKLTRGERIHVDEQRALLKSWHLDLSRGQYRQRRGGERYARRV